MISQKEMLNIIRTEAITPEEPRPVAHQCPKCGKMAFFCFGADWSCGACGFIMDAEIKFVDIP